ncbi:MAG: septum formation inhibitor Maf [Bryobacterales bacterium]|nr:septum formation inhibitor Maf [Bryobacterales bacterium]
MSLILASASPRRAEILRRAGIEFVVRPANVDETRRSGESAETYVCRLARAKAEASIGDCLVLAADTTVRAGNEILEKPADTADAVRMLRLLEGRMHDVLTGLCLRDGDRYLVEYELTRVHFRPMTEEDIAEYVASGEPMDKAGAYGIQGLASRYIDRVEGCYLNVVGLPVAHVWSALRKFAPERYQRHSDRIHASKHHLE